MEENVIEEINWEEKYNELWDKYLRLNADFDNFKKHKNNLISDMRTYSNFSVLQDLTYVLDDFERCIQYNEVSEGVELIINNIRSIFNKNEVIEIICDMFDENYHEAVGTTQIDNVESGKIVSVNRKGYIYKDRILRFAQVIVNMNK